MLFKKLLDILFPIECLGCGQNDILLCSDCLNSIKINQPDHFQNEIIDQVHVCTSFHNALLRKLIHFYKYNYMESLAEDLSKILINYYSQIDYKLNEVTIIPVPLHSKKLLVRCFNQADLIAQNFCQHFGYQFKNDLIQRIKNTKQQAQLNKAERIQNLKNSFKILDKKFVQNRDFIIIDDIYTTGSTVLEMAKILKKYGAQKIWCLVIAKN
ncbi:ComF family protein [bacterium]|nr:ComF family protein [bacterium]